MCFAYMIGGAIAVDSHLHGIYEHSPLLRDGTTGIPGICSQTKTTDVLRANCGKPKQFEVLN